MLACRRTAREAWRPADLLLAYGRAQRGRAAALGGLLRLVPLIICSRRLHVDKRLPFTFSACVFTTQNLMTSLHVLLKPLCRVKMK